MLWLDVGRAAASVTPARVSPRSPTILEDLPEKLTPERPRTEAEEDRVQAMTLFAVARVHEQHHDYAGALRTYQRALRLDPSSRVIAQEIVPLAHRLKQYDVAVRYALKAVELEDADPQLLRRLGAYLIDIGDWKRAVTLYERAAVARRGEKLTADDVELQLEMGRLYHLLEKYPKAAACFARVIDALDHPKDLPLDEKWKKKILLDPAQTYILFGECFLLADRPQEALAAFEKAEKLAPNKGLHALNLARVQARTGRPQEALAGLQVYFDEHLTSEGTLPCEVLVEVLEKLGKSKELLDRLAKLQKNDPANVPLGYFLADKYRTSGQLDKAEPIYRSLLEKTPTTFGYRNLVEIYRKTNRPEQLLGVLGQAVDKTGVLDALGAEGQAVSSDAALVKRLVDVAREKLKKEPKALDYGMRLAVGLMALENKQFEAAGEFFDLAIAAKPKQAGEVLLIWGIGLLVQERPAEAAKIFQRAIDQKALPADNPAYYFYLAGALEMAGRTDEALAAARKAADVKPLARFATREAWVLYHAGRNDAAMKVYAAIVDKFDADHDSPENRDALRECRLALSNLCVLKKQLPQAEEWLEQVLDEFPDDPGAANDLGYLWADEGKHLQRALRMTRKAVAAEPENMAYRDSLGWALFRLGQWKEAVVELEKAASAKDPDGVIFDHLGDACAKNGQPDKAREAWRKAIEAFRKAKETDKAKETERKIKS